MKIRVIIIILLIIAGIAIPVKFAYDALASQTAQAQDQTQTQQSQQNPNTASNRKFINNLGPDEYTPSDYMPPSYDPFNNLYRAPADYKDEYPPLQQPNTKPQADFIISVKNRHGLAENDAGTVGTQFRFDATPSVDKETDSSRLQVRWDFESDGRWDSYFSTSKSLLHTFSKPGTYNVTLEVLDTGGAVSTAVKQVKIVENTPPTPYQVATPKSGTTGTVFSFDTGKSSDSQYLKPYLEYRFDWNNDGIWDTQFDGKTFWRHKFDKSGSYRVVMQVKDPEGLTATWYQDVTVIQNTPPQAHFTVSQNNTTYTFNASGSTDAETPKDLQYRWDFNYTGPDDIVYDTAYSSSPIYTGSYSIPGQKKIRLEVKDPDGATGEAYAELDAG